MNPEAPILRGSALKSAHCARFNILSIENWLQIAALAGIAFIPAREIGRIPTDLPMRLLDNPGDDEAIAAIPKNDMAAWMALCDAVQSLGDREMLRWDPCGGSSTKSTMARGLAVGEIAQGIRPPWSDGRRYVEVDDPRLIDVLAEYDHPDVPVFARPWIDGRLLPSPGISGRFYPVEFRVFCQKGQVAGISAYYPQCPVPDDSLTRQGVDGAHRAAEAMLSYMADHELMPDCRVLAEGRRRGLVPEGIGCTLDFLQLPNGTVQLIEGGPPFTNRWGAHPCCFGDDEPNGVRLALAPATCSDPAG